MKDLVYRSPMNTEVQGEGFQPGCGLCKGCHVKPGEAYYSDGRLLCEDCLIDEMIEDYALEADLE